MPVLFRFPETSTIHGDSDAQGNSHIAIGLAFLLASILIGGGVLLGVFALLHHLGRI